MQGSFSKKDKTVERKQQFEARHGEELAAMYARQTGQIAKQIRELERSRRFILKPGKHKVLYITDVLSTTALLYTALFTPFEAGFLAATTGSASWSDGWFLMNRVLDVIFLVDMCFQFFIAYEEADQRGGKSWVFDQRKVVRHYLTRWFPLDSFTLFVPAAFDFYLTTMEGDTGGGGGGGGGGNDDGPGGIVGNMSLLRILRCVRLVKLVRLIRASRVYERWKNKVSLSHKQVTWLQIAFMIMLSAHWFACLMGLQASLHSTPQDTWIGEELYGLCADDGNGNGTSSSMDIASSMVSSVTHTGCGSLTVGDWYNGAFSWSAMVITGTGGTDHYPSRMSGGENAVVALLVLCGALLWGKVLSMFCDVASNSSPGVAIFREQLDGLNEFCKNRELSRDMSSRMREYLYQQKGAQLLEHAAKSLPRLSIALQVEVILHCHRHWLDAIWFLKEIEEICRVRLAMSMASQVLAPGEVAPQRQLYVISRGLVLFGGRVLSKGMCWGDDVLLTDPRYFLPYLARAMTYTDVYVLSSEKLNHVLSSFPNTANKLRRAAILLAMRRHVIEISKEVRAKKEAAKAAAEGKKDFIDQVQDAAQTASKKQAQSVNIAVELQSRGSFNKSRARRDQRASVEEEEALQALQADVFTIREEMQTMRQLAETVAKGLGVAISTKHRWAQGQESAGSSSTSSRSSRSPLTISKGPTPPRRVRPKAKTAVTSSLAPTLAGGGVQALMLTAPTPERVRAHDYVEPVAE